MARSKKPAPAPFTVITDRERRDVALWLVWSAIAGRTFATADSALREFVRHSLRAARADYLAMPRPFRKLLMLEVRDQMQRRLTPVN